ncbi:hypothetical protein ATK36_1796 [Amycolatopsis sulphurea]|uniref:Uncharacterized protein n=1 Tax=Amycolatopsis sulphurea TaxID=76022 RepID=A0A2A9F8R2_9PSEU|nr:hypothetical protein ATK36_1796 [Amycolatopsis sulphurea]
MVVQGSAQAVAPGGGEQVDRIEFARFRRRVVVSAGGRWQRSRRSPSPVRTSRGSRRPDGARRGGWSRCASPIQSTGLAGSRLGEVLRTRPATSVRALRRYQRRRPGPRGGSALLQELGPFQVHHVGHHLR